MTLQVTIKYYYINSVIVHVIVHILCSVNINELVPKYYKTLLSKL